MSIFLVSLSLFIQFSLDLSLPSSTDIPPGIDFPIIANLEYSFDDAVRNSIAAETEFSHLDLGPVDTLDPEILV